MKPFKILLFFVAIITSAVLVTASSKPVVKSNSTPGKGFAVIELFTSEGCSSCPSADAVVAKIQKEDLEQPVYILAYHVDYWNRLGWRDVFSNAAFSKRQYQYANWIKGSSVYTPQIVVNGRKEFIGSKEGTLRNAITSGEKKASSAQLALSDLKIEGGKVGFMYYAEGIKDNTNLVYAIVQRNAQTKVEAGENSGRTLSHVQIVRELQNITLNGKGSGNTNINLPKGLNTHELEVIAFLQNQADGEIIAAYKTNLEAVKIAMAK